MAHLPHGSFTRDLWLAWTLGRYLGRDLDDYYLDVHYALGGGFYCRLPGEQQEQVRQILSEPRLIRLAGDITCGLAPWRLAARAMRCWMTIRCWRTGDPYLEDLIEARLK